MSIRRFTINIGSFRHATCFLSLLEVLSIEECDMVNKGNPDYHKAFDETRVAIASGRKTTLRV
jgi:hypothetical protein